jgi:hypothetical protein
MPRPQFTLRTLLVAMLVVGAFLGGRAAGTREERIRLVNQLFAEQDRYERNMTESTARYETRLAEDFKEFQRQLDLKDAMLDNRDAYIQKLRRQLAETEKSPDAELGHWPIRR